MGQGGSQEDAGEVSVGREGGRFSALDCESLSLLDAAQGPKATTGKSTSTAGLQLWILLTKKAKGGRHGFGAVGSDPSATVGRKCCLFAVINRENFRAGKTRGIVQGNTYEVD